jgi:hypothetical protein
LASDERRFIIPRPEVRLLMKKHLLGVLVGLCALAVGGLGYSFGAYYGGRAEARFDLLRGRHSLRIYGAPHPADADYRDILSREYGVEAVVVDDCTVSRELVEESRGYNEVMEAAIEKRHGAGVFERAWRRAEAEHQSKHGGGARE